MVDLSPFLNLLESWPKILLKKTQKRGVKKTVFFCKSGLNPPFFFFEQKNRGAKKRCHFFLKLKSLFSQGFATTLILDQFFQKWLFFKSVKKCKKRCFFCDIFDYFVSHKYY